jgi:hypothetical protein
MIDRCGGLVSHARTVARGVERKPQPHAMTSPTPPRQPAARARESALSPLGETWAK